MGWQDSVASAATAAAIAAKAGEVACEQKYACMGWLRIRWRRQRQPQRLSSAIAAEAGEAACEQQHAWGGRIRWRRQRQRRR